MRKLRIRSRKPLKVTPLVKSLSWHQTKVGGQSFYHTNLQQQTVQGTYLTASNPLTIPMDIWEAWDRFWMVLPPSELLLSTWELPASWDLQILHSPSSETYLTWAFLPQELGVSDQYKLMGQSKLARGSQTVQRPLSWQRSILLSPKSIQPPPTSAMKFVYWKAFASEVNCLYGMNYPTFKKNLQLPISALINVK